MTVRKLKKTELDFLAEMLYEAIFIPEGHAPLPRAVIKDRSLSKYIDTWGKDTFDIAWVVNVGHQLVGAIWGRLLTADNKAFGYVDDHTPELSMALTPAYRNQG